MNLLKPIYLPQSPTQRQDSLLLRRWSSLLLLIIFTTTTSIISQRSRKAQPYQQTYSVATSVLMTEIIKFLVSSVAVFFSPPEAVDLEQSADHLDKDPSSPIEDEKSFDSLQDASFGSRRSSASDTPLLLGFKSSTHRSIEQTKHAIFNPSTIVMGVPALIYVVQNLLQLISNTYLSAVAYQALSQLKLITAALISVFLFDKSLNRRQWLCLPLLLFGVVLLSARTQIPKHPLQHLPQGSPFNRPVASLPVTTSLTTQALSVVERLASFHYLMGALSVVLSCICGSFAGVYMESKLKATMSVPLSIKNAQLASFSIITASAALILESIVQRRFNPFENFHLLAWVTIFLRAASGYVTSATLRYADSILKGFATSMAINLTIAIESALTSSLPTTKQILGSILVLASTYLYIRASRTNQF